MRFFRLYSPHALPVFIAILDSTATLNPGYCNRPIGARGFFWSKENYRLIFLLLRVGGKVMALFFYDTNGRVSGAVQKVYANILRARAAEGDGTLYVSPGKSPNKVDVSTLTDGQLQGYKLLNFNGKAPTKEAKFGCYTERFGYPIQSVTPSLYFSQVPTNPAFLAGVDCDTAEFDPAWFPNA